jgi:protein-ribulosamine 3-kinase
MIPLHCHLDSALQKALSEVIGSDSGSPPGIDSVSDIGGGSISRALLVESGGQRYFVKLNDAGLAEMFAAEADGLSALAGCPAVRVPHVFGHGVAARQAYLVLEYLPLQALRERTQGAQPGMRWRPAPHPGRTAWLAPRQFHRQYAAVEYRASCLAFLLRPPASAAAARTGQATHPAQPTDRSGERLSEKLRRCSSIISHSRVCCMGICGMATPPPTTSGKLALFDPAVYFGDREADLAMSELFGGFPDSFYAAYREAWPLDDGFEQRKTLYNLYHVLNHLNLFGSGYLHQAERMIARLLAEIAG